LENTVGTTTYSYDLNGNTTSVVLPPGKPPVTMSYDKENRLTVHQSGSSVATYAYDGFGLKRVEYVDGALTTLIWDGTDYLQGRS
jgi:YD repeat-containing protein